jgi:RNA polymerase sigma factor (sigma-70 family)
MRDWRICGPRTFASTSAIQSLPGHYREVILLRDIEEMSIDEIAAVLGLTRESVKARIHRARMLIREYLIRD